MGFYQSTDAYWNMYGNYISSGCLSPSWAIADVGGIVYLYLHRWLSRKQLFHKNLSGARRSNEEYAPINKVVIHTGDQQTGFITHDDSTFCYIINFQNVTADTARHVRIIDRISPNLDIRTISQPFSMSPHKFYILDDQTVVWEMDDIAMPDTASGYINSYSFVQYNIRMKQGLPVGTEIENSAWVYFNREDSIMTNITRNTIVDPDGILNSTTEEQVLRVYPNPSSKGFHVAFESGATGNYILEIRNLLGQTVYVKDIYHDSMSLVYVNAELPSGCYHVSLRGLSRTYSTKVIVE